MEDQTVFRALADPSRRRLLDLLFARDGRTLTELESELPMTRFGVMKHLRVLEEAGLITTRKLDQLGFDSVWVWDHYMSWNDPRESVLECWTTLAGLAEATRHIRLGPLVANNTNRHPGRLAKVAATLHELSGGRLELGIGAGGRAVEQSLFGIDQGDRAERTARLAEALQIIPALWTGEPVTFQGRYYQLNDAIAAPRQHPRPRIIVGGRSVTMARLAGQYADGLNLQWSFRET